MRMKNRASCRCPTAHPLGGKHVAGVPVTAVYLPHTDHMFDAGTKWSPEARVVLYTLERLLAVLSVTDPARRGIRGNLGTNGPCRRVEVGEPLNERKGDDGSHSDKHGPSATSCRAR
jgi:hypothetical protein